MLGHLKNPSAYHVAPYLTIQNPLPINASASTPPHLVDGLGAIGHEGDLTWPMAQVPKSGLLV